MSDQLSKKVRIVDNISIEVYLQGKRKYAIINNNGEITRGDKVNYSNDDDSIIHDALINFASNKGKDVNYYKIIQDPYVDPFTQRTYGNGILSPYYLNNGCKLCIQWTGSIPNPDFSLGTYSIGDEVITQNDRYLSNQVITSNVDDAMNQEILPQSTWVDINGKRDTSHVDNKSIIILLPNGFTENDGKGYLVWYNSNLQYSNKSTNTNDFSNSVKDSDIIETVITKYQMNVKNLYGIDYDLKLCSPDTNYCNIIPYKSPLENPNPSPINQSDDKLGSSQSVSKTKPIIDGLPDTIQVKAKVNLPSFTVWTGPIPKINNDEYDYFNDSEISDEYLETNYSGEEETAIKLSAGEGINSDEEIQSQRNYNAGENDPNNNNTPGGSTGLKSLGTYYSELPNESFKGSSGIKPGFNSVPYYQQFDKRWADIIYGLSDGGIFVEATIPPARKSVSVQWQGNTYNVKCDHFKGEIGFSSIQGGGCGITSISMIINYWAVKGKCKYTSPIKIAKMSSENGSRSGPPCNGTSPGGKSGSFGKSIKNNFNINFDVTNSKDAQEFIKNGYPILFCGQNFIGKNSKGGNTKSYSGHFIVITGYDNDKWRVNDPGRIIDECIIYFDTFPTGSFWKFIPK